MKVDFKIVEYRSSAYTDVLALQEAILREPVGLKFTPEEVADDKDYLHIGGYINEELCCATALVPEGDNVRMIRVATAPAFQNRGIGTLLLKYCEGLVKERGFTMITLNARERAVPFYQRSGYSIEGEMFMKLEIPHLKMFKKIV